MSDGASRLHGVLTPKMSAAELSRKLKVSQQLVYNWTHGLSRPDLTKRERIERLTGIPASSWLSAEERSEMRRALGSTGTES